MIWGQISPAHGDRGAKPPEGRQKPLILVVVCCGCVFVEASVSDSTQIADLTLEIEILVEL